MQIVNRSFHKSSWYYI